MHMQKNLMVHPVQFESCLVRFLSSSLSLIYEARLLILNNRTFAYGNISIRLINIEF